MKKIICIKMFMVYMGLLFPSIYTFSQSGWIQQNSGTGVVLNKVSFTSANNGTVVGDGGTILHTTNGGTNWILQTSGTTFNLHGVSFIDAYTGTVVGLHNVIRHTTNGGADWISQQLPDTFVVKNFLSVCFADASTGIIVGAESGTGDIYRTTNGGANWYRNYEGYYPGIVGVSFVNGNTGSVAGYSGYPPIGIILSTTNGGLSWAMFNGNPPPIPALYDVSVADVNNRIAVGYNGTIFHTTDGGSNWYSQISGTTNNLQSVCLENANNGTIVGNNGTILHTNNGGSNWYPQISGTTSILYGVCFSDTNIGTAVGEGGIILKTTTGGNPVGIKPIPNQIPKVLMLSQNYPNPFNPTTNIKYQIPKTNYIKLVIYDILGKEVTVLVNEKQNPGTYEVEWNGSNYPSGVYFYKLITEAFTMTKKMILMK